MTIVESAPLLLTPMHALHAELGAKMVPFAGYEMPLQYASGIVREHLHARSAAALFDVSHMGQIRLTGDLDALERLCPIDLATLRSGQQRYTVFTNASGGILDDLMVARVGDHLMLVVNAGRKQEDAAHLRQHLAQHCRIEELADRALLALQGPLAATVLARLAPSTAELEFMTGAWFTLGDAECFVTRSGYTGEDGFEISVASGDCDRLARALLAHAEVAPAGLGARDTLRLEAGLCLHGHDIDGQTTPIEADLAWVIARSRRDGPRASYPGADVVLRQLREGPERLRTGLLPEGRMPVREGSDLIDTKGRTVGRVTSGGFGPSLGRPIAMGYLGTSAAGAPVHAVVRGKPIALTRAQLPFVTPRYHRRGNLNSRQKAKEST